MSLLVVGSVGLDSIRTPYDEVKDVLGGSATYFAASASFFTRVRVVAVIGSDFPLALLSFLKKRNVDLRGLEIKEGKTFRWKAEYGDMLDAARTLSTCLNVFGEFKPVLPSDYRRCRHVFLSNIDPRLQESVLKQTMNPKLIAADSMNFWIENTKKELLKVLKKIDIFFANDNEAREISGESNLMKAGRAIISHGPKVVVIKKGEHGALLISRDFCFAAPGLLVNTVRDTTGAGDSFAGGFMGYLARGGKLDGNSLRRAVIYGNVLASFTVENFSIRRFKSVASDDIKQRYRQFREFVRF